MKLKQKLAMVLAATSAFSAVPVTTMVMGASQVMAAEYEYSWVSNTIKVTEGMTLTQGIAPILTIKDDFGVWKKGEPIYITLDGAEWTDEMVASLIEVRDSANKPIVTTESSIEKKPVMEKVPVMETVPVMENVPVMEMVPVLDEEGNPTLDEEGNPILTEQQKVDADGNLMFEEKQKTDADGNPLFKEQQKVDANGAPLFDEKQKVDADGNLVFENVEVDKEIDNFIIRKEGKNTIALIRNFDEQEAKIRMPLLAKIKDNVSGDIKVIIEGESTGIRNGEHVFATASEEKASVKAGDVVKFATRETKINPIEINESYIGALKVGDKIEFEIDRDFEFDMSYTGTPKITAKYGDMDDFAFKFVKDECDETLIVLEVTKANPSRTRRASFYFDGIQIRTEARDSEEYGKVHISVTGKDVKSDDLQVAEYVKYGASSEVEKTTDVLAGREVTLPKVTLKENVADSIRFDRALTIDFPEWVNVVGVKSAKLGNTDVTDVIKEAFEINSKRLDKTGKDKEIVSGAVVDFERPTSTKPLELSIEFVVETKADAEGDIEVVFGGRAVDKEDITLKVSEVQPVVKVTAEETYLNVGYKGQPVGKIEIKESQKGALNRGKILVSLEDLEHGKFDEVPTVKVVDGNIKLGDVKLLKNGTLEIEVKTPSRTASTIEISNATMTANRMIADGEYDIKVSGEAVMDKNLLGSEWDNGVGSKFITVGEKKAEVKKVVFAIGQNSYTVDGENRFMDTASYIDSNNRTMVPIRYVATALGISEDNIIWNKVDRTVTIFNGQQVVQLTIDSNVMKVNGMSIPMDTKATIKDERTMLPISWVANALNVPYTWDASARTVTFEATK